MLWQRWGREYVLGWGLTAGVASLRPMAFLAGPRVFAATMGTAVQAVFLLQDTATHPCSLRPPTQVPWHAVLGNHDYCDSAPGCNTTDGCPNSPLHQVRV